MKVDVQRLRAMIEAATPGPLHADDVDGVWCVARESGTPGGSGFAVDGECWKQADAELIAAAVNALPELLAIAEASEWISVKDRLPPDGDCVLCYEDRKCNQFVSQFCADLCGDGKPGFVEEWYEKALTTDGTQGWGHWPFVTHWRPLPKAPVRLVRVVGEAK